MNNIFRGIFDSDLANVISVQNFLLCMVCALVIGILFAVTYCYHTKYTKSFVFTLAMIPAVVCVVIMMVNGNVGTGVAVAGAFSLVRFRSIPGTAKEIGVLFMAMGSGLIAGMGYLSYAFLFTVILCGITLLYNSISFSKNTGNDRYQSLVITIPEDLDYNGVFDEIMKQYTKSYELTHVKTTNMGSMFRLSYQLEMKTDVNVRNMINEIRCRNGNLEVSMYRQENSTPEL